MTMQANQFSNRWTIERTALCVNFWNEGLSAGTIAARLGGISRNAVIGKIHRLSREKGSPFTVTRAVARKFGSATRFYGKRDPKAKTQRQPRVVFNPDCTLRRAPQVACSPLPPEPERPATLVSFTDLEDHQCRFIYGDPKADGGFCGCQTATGSSYCEGHHHVVFTVPEPRRRKSSETPTHLFRLYDTGSRKEVEV